ncbi:MAG: hypothetical protein IKV10_01350, partial [Alphaproteobacteria bacterium]|nr:hypothetical protein [Alphaproteobacteria bacterium]
PYQAEYTCRLLDKNTYGSSFAAVANSGDVTAEYNKNVGAYNKQQNGKLDKNMPLGPDLNDGNPGVDGVRGHYARWDAPSATCLVRVAAYNKDKQITNSWLFGAAGDDKSAEVWRAAGDTFTCNKDLFGFSLMNDTKTAALVGVGGGTLLGAGVGAAVGQGPDMVLVETRMDCEAIGAEGTINSEEWQRSCVEKYIENNPALFGICRDNNLYTVQSCGDAVHAAQEAASKAQRGNRGATAAIGAATGAATGGLATAITAFVEKNNISCRVGDGLESVGYGKSYSIETLRDFYVKWDLQLPEKL